ncbi:MAG: methyltransferase domain-containing protein [Candidatus Nanopelagicales bacterium]
MSTHTWDAAGYDASFSFVTSYGAVLLDLLAAQPGERVLDLGCGTGHQAAEVAAAGAQVVGVDADAAMLEIARAEHPEVAFVRADGQDADALRAAVDGPVDAVLSNAALHWMPRQDDVVAAVAAVLRPGGRFVAEMGGGANVALTTQAIRAGRAAVGLDPGIASSWTFPTPGEQAARLERHGFDVRLVQCFDRTTPLAAGSTSADWARMFGAALVADVPDADRARFDAAVDAAAAELGLARRPDGEPGWWADYVRLRFVGVRR